MRIHKILSSASTAMNLVLAFALARRFGYSGVEVLPHRFTTAQGLRRLEDKYGVPVTAIHLPWWTWRGALYWMSPRSTWRTLQQEWKRSGKGIKSTVKALLYDAFINKLQTITWLLIMGPLGDGPLDNPGLRLAHELDLPVVVHPGPILELVQPPLNGWPQDPKEREEWKEWARVQLGVFGGIREIRVENNDAPFHPDSNFGEGMDQALFCRQLLRLCGFQVNLVFDGEHLAKEIGFWGLMTLERKLLPVLQKLPRGSVVEAHVCGYDPNEGGVKKGGHLSLGVGCFPVKHNLLALVHTEASLEPFEVTVETPPGIGDFLKLLFFGNRAGETYLRLLQEQADNKAFLDTITP